MTHKALVEKVLAEFKINFLDENGVSDVEFIRRALTESAQAATEAVRVEKKEPITDGQVHNTPFENTLFGAKVQAIHRGYNTAIGESKLLEEKYFA